MLEALLEPIAGSFGNWLSVLLAMPLVGVLFVAFAPNNERTIKHIALTFSILTFVVAAPSRPESITLRRELPRVCPSPRGKGSATNRPCRSSSSSTLKRGGAMSNIVKKPPTLNEPLRLA